MKNIIIGSIGILWGGAILVSGFAKGGVNGEGAYATGSMGGLIFGGVMLLGGLYYVIKGKKKTT